MCNYRAAGVDHVGALLVELRYATRGKGI